MRYTVVLIVVIIMISCRSKQIVASRVVNREFLDTLIFADSLDFLIAGENKILSDSIADIALEEYFSKLGYYQTKDSATTNFEKDFLMCVSFDTLHKIHLNNDKFIDAIVEYYDTPCFSSSHCYVPHTGLLTYINGKYRFSNPDILPDSFYIDSISQGTSFPVIYGGDYNCGEGEVTRHYRARIIPR